MPRIARRSGARCSTSMKRNRSRTLHRLEEARSKMLRLHEEKKERESSLWRRGILPRIVRQSGAGCSTSMKRYRSMMLRHPVGGCPTWGRWRRFSGALLGFLSGESLASLSRIEDDMRSLSVGNGVALHRSRGRFRPPMGALYTKNGVALPRKLGRSLSGMRAIPVETAGNFTLVRGRTTHQSRASVPSCAVEWYVNCGQVYHRARSSGASIGGKFDIVRGRVVRQLRASSTSCEVARRIKCGQVYNRAWSSDASIGGKFAVVRGRTVHQLRAVGGQTAWGRAVTTGRFRSDLGAVVGFFAVRSWSNNMQEDRTWRGF